MGASTQVRDASTSLVNISPGSTLRTTALPYGQHRPSQSLSLDDSTLPQSASRKSVPQIIGEDRESWRLDEADKVDAKGPWQGTLKQDTPTHDHNEFQELPAMILGLPNVQNTLVYSPMRRTETTGLQSPISLGPHSPGSSESSKGSSPQSPTPDLSDVPKYISAFEYAMRPYVDAHIDCEWHLSLPSPIGEGYTQAASPLLPLFQDDKTSYSTSAHDGNEKDIPEYGIPSYLKEGNVFRTRMLHVQLRTLLMRCIILQSSVREIERKPWTWDAQQPPHWYYSKMRHLSQKARRLAEALQSQDLRARCEYWTGRGCGGTRDYYAAAEHFALAIKLDVENDMHPSGRTRLRGLRPNEKADVHFLLDSVTNRHDSWEHRMVNARNMARYESNRSGKPLEECKDLSGMESPLWVPDRDRIMQLARQESGIKKRLGKRAKLMENFGELKDRVKAQWDAEGIDEAEITRRVLNKKEWHYIHHGDQKVVAQRTRQELAALAAGPRPTVTRERNRTIAGSPSSSSSSSAPSCGSQTLSPFSHPTLEDELAQAGWHSTSPSPPYTPSHTPSPAGGLAQRRNIALDPIDTETIKKHISLGEAVGAAPGVSDTSSSPPPLSEGSSDTEEDEASEVDLRGKVLSAKRYPEVMSGGTTPRAPLKSPRVVGEHDEEELEGESEDGESTPVAIDILNVNFGESGEGMVGND